MNAETKKRNDERYDWWSAEEDHQLIQISRPTKRAIAMANQWHEYFLWRPIAEKVHSVPLFGTYTAARAMMWNNHAFYDVFFNPLFAPYSDWGKDIDQYSDAKIYEDVVGYTIMYERAVDSPYLKELGKIQDECEELVGDLWLQTENLNEANAKLSALLPFGKAEARQKKEDAEKKIPLLREQIDQKLARVNEIRAIIPGK